MYVKDFIPSEKRATYAEGGIERRMYEAAVMVAVSQHLIDLQRQCGENGKVSIHPDGQHDRQYSFREALGALGFQRCEALGKTEFGGRYRHGDDEITVFPQSGRGDVTAHVEGRLVMVECKGGTLNSRHAGVLSRARSSLSELIGQLMVLPDDGARHIAARPWSKQSEELARRLAPRCIKAGIEIALVHEDGSLQFVT